VSETKTELIEREDITILPDLREFSEGEGLQLTAQRIESNEEFSRALSSFPIVGIDILLVNFDRKTVYLAERRARPLKGSRWFIGGRILTGETPEVAASRIFKRETGQVLDPGKLAFLFQARYFLKDREQEPHDAGTDAFSFTFSLAVNDDEIAKIRTGLDPKEYESGAGLEEFDSARLDSDEVLTPVVSAFDSIFLASE